MRFPVVLWVLSLAALVQSSSILLSGGTIIAFDEANEALSVIRNGSVLVTANKIVEIYDATQPGQLPKDTEVIDCTNKIISPGFIDTHHHGSQTALKTIASNTSLAEYFGRYGEFVALDHYTSDDVYIGQLAGLYEALNAGTTTILDHAHHTWSNDTAKAGLQASIDSGARVFWAYAFHNVTNFTIPEQMANYRDLLTSVPTNNTLTTQVIAYDGLSFNQFGQETQDIISLARELNVAAFTSHSLGGPWAYDNSPEMFQDAGLLNTSIPVILSHASFLTATGATLLRETNQYISITPESEMHYGHGHIHNHLVQDQSALGVDTHMTFSTDIITQARIWLQNTRLTLYREVLDKWQVGANNPMSVNQAFLLATRNGGLALKRNDLGVIVPGAQADLVVFDGRSPGLLGWVDPVAAIILHANVGDIEHVIVGGEFKKRDGKLTVADYADVVDRFLTSAARLQAIWRDIPLPSQEGFFFGGAYQLGLSLQVDSQRGSGTGYGVNFV